MSRPDEYIHLNMMHKAEFHNISLQLHKREDCWDDLVRINTYSITIGKEATSAANASFARSIFSHLNQSNYDVVGFGAHKDLTAWFFQIREDLYY